ncbi:uncharacterized protein LOC143294347 [Babylonia areolata]|uniref:uncharacterized protein LOC143294347 n=1 Tax=Babylonia areolata TaxID=304850 RepID=UPI003FD66AD3
MNLSRTVCLFVIVVSMTLPPSRGAKDKAATKTKEKVEEEEVTVEDISEEEYKEQLKQEAHKADKPSRPQTPEPKDARPQDSDVPKSGQPETGTARETGTADAGKDDVESSEGEKADLKEEEEEGDSEEEGEAKGEEEEEQEEEEEEEHEAPSGIRDPRPCEVCKYLAVELQGRLLETGKVKEFIETGHGIMPGDRKRKEYKKSELRFIEAVHEPHVCDKLLDYDIHAERKRSLRYAKGQSETRKTLHWLRMKGVKVDMGMPEEMWTSDNPSTEITHLNRLCIDMVEMYEEAIEDWYWGHQEQHLYDYLCRDRALRNEDQECLLEEVGAPAEKKDEEKEENEDSQSEGTDSTTKGDDGVPSSTMSPAGDATSSSPASGATQTASPGPSQTQPDSPSSSTPKSEL